jgi:hypothetical protein
METVAGTFDPLLTETLAHMFRLDKDLSPRAVRGRRFTTARVPRLTERQQRSTSGSNDCGRNGGAR